MNNETDLEKKHRNSFQNKFVTFSPIRLSNALAIQGHSEVSVALFYNDQQPDKIFDWGCG